MNKQRHVVAIVALALLASAASTPGQEDDLRQRFGLQPLPPLPHPENNLYNPRRPPAAPAAALSREHPLHPRSRRAGPLAVFRSHSQWREGHGLRYLPSADLWYG